MSNKLNLALLSIVLLTSACSTFKVLAHASWSNSTYPKTVMQNYVFAPADEMNRMLLSNQNDFRKYFVSLFDDNNIKFPNVAPYNANGKVIGKALDLDKISRAHLWYKLNLKNQIEIASYIVQSLTLQSKSFFYNILNSNVDERHKLLNEWLINFANIDMGRSIVVNKGKINEFYNNLVRLKNPFLMLHDYLSLGYSEQDFLKNLSEFIIHKMNLKDFYNEVKYEMDSLIEETQTFISSMEVFESDELFAGMFPENRNITSEIRHVFGLITTTWGDAQEEYLAKIAQDMHLQDEPAYEPTDLNDGDEDFGQ